MSAAAGGVAATGRLLQELAAAGSTGSVAVLSGAGISVAAGIPDFRSPGGMYDTLRPELLTASPADRRAMGAEPTTVVSWGLFRNNPLPYLEVRRPFILGTAAGKWRATLGHFFLRVLHDKGLLRRVFTQNIDGLDFQVGIPDDKIVPVHGSIGKVSCEFCKAPVPLEAFCEKVERQIRNIYPDAAGVPDGPPTSTPIQCESCGRNGVKPSTVLYGRPLPAEFQERSDADLPQVSLLIVAGTSLTVSPANEVPLRVGPACRRVLVNRDRVGEDLGILFAEDAQRDLFLPGDTDTVFLDLAQAAGWLGDLAAYKDQMAEPSQQLLERRVAAQGAAPA